VSCAFFRAPLQTLHGYWVVSIEKMIDEFAVFYLLSDLHQKIYFKVPEFSVEDDLFKLFERTLPRRATSNSFLLMSFLMGGTGHAHTLRPGSGQSDLSPTSGWTCLCIWLI
jgi:hypothetical protein